MTWINVDYIEPPSELNRILVWSLACNSPHVAYFSNKYQEWINPVFCNPDGTHVQDGVGFRFKYWMKLPEGPES